MLLVHGHYKHTEDMVIFACLNFREFLISGFFTKFRIREFSFLFSSAIMNITRSAVLLFQCGDQLWTTKSTLGVSI